MKLLGVIEACTMICENFITAFSMALPHVAAAVVTWELCTAEGGNPRTRTGHSGRAFWPWEDQRCQRLL